MPIFDQGYQHWNGQLSSQLWRWWAVTRNGVRMQFRSKLTRFCLIACFGPALALAAFMILWSLFEQGNTTIKTLLSFLPDDLKNLPANYRVTMWTLAYHFFFLVQSFLLMILVLLVGPGLISKDLRFNALPLYLSRPLRRWEYFLGKLGVIMFFVLLVTAAPAVFAWVLGVLFSLKLSIFFEVLPLLWGILLVSLIIAVVYGLWMLALSSLSRNSRYVAMMWFGWWLLSGALSVILFFSSGFAEWSNLASFTRNVQRVQEHILNTEAAWQKVDQIARTVQKAGGKAIGRRLEFDDGDDRLLLTRVPRSHLQTGETNIRSSSLRSLYPWYWSAGVLVFMGVLSLCILMFRVKSLDRLR
ncbi:MAG TPA: ABC transporter permease subunit [Gemmatales bacterium]|nr:ABC transporter permease subunit [Gemmatales bacterium]